VLLAFLHRFRVECLFFNDNFMRLKLILLTWLIASLTVRGQDFRPTYVYDGYILTDKNQKLDISLNFLILLDSTMIGSYHYNHGGGPLKLVGQLYADNSFYLVERTETDSITGNFRGRLSSDKKLAEGLWASPKKGKEFNFKINQADKKSYWDYIKQNRSIFEYHNIAQAIGDRDKVLSIDVANQRLERLPKQLSTLNKIISINLLGNQFRSFPKVLSKLKTLDEISLSSNRLTYVGQEIGRLNNLRILIMNNNQLKKLPKEIGELTNLLYLEIGNNELNYLPQQIKYLTQLQELHIERNKLTDIEKQKIRGWLPNCVIYF
jgi:hypothetical protein